MVNTLATEGPVAIVPDLERVENTLAESYGLRPVSARRVPVGQGTVNFVVECRERTVFVKQFGTETDWPAERAAIELSQLAGGAGVPVADVIADTTGDLLHRSDGFGMSVWDYVEASGVDGPISPDRMAAAGAALGRTHRCFLAHPANREPARETARWFDIDIDRHRETVRALLGEISSRPVRDDFDDRAERTLRERLADLDRIPGLLAPLPRLTSQVLHGDYSSLNLLFHGEDLAAVVDFRPPGPFLLSYELGRIALDTHNVALSDDWLARATALIEAYVTENPGVPRADVVHSGRIWLVHLIRSLYGVKNHYLSPGLFQNDLDAFWFRRHRTARTLLTHLEAVENAFATAAFG